MDELLACRVKYRGLFGKDPRPCELPSAAQLTALRALLMSGRSLYVDFAVWGPYGPRVMKQRMSEALQFFEGGWKTNVLPGPTTVESWMASAMSLLVQPYLERWTTTLLASGSCAPCSPHTLA